MKIKKLLIPLFFLVICIFAFAGCTDNEQPIGGGEVEILGIYAGFNANSEQLNGTETLQVYHLKTGETYEFNVSVSHRGSRDVKISKNGVKIYFDTDLMSFDEGEYIDDPDPNATPTDGFPFYFTCYDKPAYTEIFVVSGSFWCRVSAIIEN